MLYGYPVERLCTYQYSLISLMPGELFPLSSHSNLAGLLIGNSFFELGLLLNLGDAADPSLDFRTGPTKRPSSLRTSDRNSLLRYMGLPLHTFGKVNQTRCRFQFATRADHVLLTRQDAFFQPYLPLQQIDMLSAKSWLVGTTNSIVTQQRDCQWDLLINVRRPVTIEPKLAS